MIKTMNRMLMGIAVLAITVVKPVEAGFNFEIRTFNGAVPQSNFNLGDTVTVRLFAVDTAGTNPDFATQNITNFNTRLFASTSDVDLPTPPVTPPPPTYNAGFNAGSFTSGQFFGGTGRILSANASAGGFLATSPLQLAEFTYAVNVPGPTTISFDPNPAISTLGYQTLGAAGPTLSSSPGQLTGATVTAVPEPTTIALLGIVAAGFGLRHLRRKNAM